MKLEKGSTMMNDQAKVRRHVCMIVLLGGAAMALIGAASRFSWTRPIDAWVAMLPAEGRPIPLAELPSLYPDAPANENAALVYIKMAYVSYDIDSSHPFHRWTHPERSDPPEAWEPIPTAVYDALAKSVNKHAGTFDVLHEAVALPHSRYPGVNLTDMYRRSLSHLVYLRSWTRLEAWRIALCAERDDAAGALDALKDGLAIGHSLAGEPILSSQRTRWECDRNILWALPRLVSRAHLTDAQLQTLSKCIALLEYTEGIHKAIVAELSFTMGNRGAYSGLMIWDSPENAIQAMVRAAAMTGFSWWNSFGLSDVEAAQCADFAGWIIPMSRTTVLDGSTRKWRLNYQSYDYGVKYTAFGFGFIDGELTSMLRAESRPVAVKHVALTAIAIERYRLAKHVLPTKLEDLVPAYMPQVLPDTFGAKRLRYKVDGDGYQLYSVGNNGKDDGGRGYGNGTGSDDIAVWSARPAMTELGIRN